MTGQRTEIEVEAWRYCYDCRRPTLIQELVTRQRVVSVSHGTIAHPFSLFPSRSSSETYRLVDVCLDCEAYQVADGKQRFLERCVGVSGLALLFFGYWHVVVAAIAGYLGVKGYCRYGWRLNRKYKQLRLTMRGKP